MKPVLHVDNAARPVPSTMAGKTGVLPGQKQCVVLKGICRDDSCTSIDDTIGVCGARKKCCRRWWILYPYPTPIPKGKSP
ncbi:beta-defensin 130-like [Otolemur garnettii]|uniref:beta-defensin 130-like n=1 Tax=Otolemur garnettii TaxID=30611 RepID=UPI000C7F470A|nr:beta-defensin 130-like [Otolemur garnettii]